MKCAFSTKLIAGAVFLTASVAVLCAVHSSAAQVVVTDNIPDAPFDGVLLLANGGVIRGTISRTADRWIVKNADHELEVPVKNVDMACHSLVEAYELRRKQMPRPTPEGHLALAEWCLRYDLFPQAALELIDVRALDPQSPRLRMLNERLAVATRPRPEATASSPSPAKKAPPIAANHGPSPVQPKSVTPRTKAPDLKAIAAETQSEMAPPIPMSEAAIERFTRKVQPVLVNSCTTAGCHQPGGAQTFQLDRALLHGLSNRHSTMTNLSATVALIDRERPQHSPLLTVPRTVHGGMDRPVFGPHQDQLVSQLMDWVTMVTAAEQPAENAALAATSDTTQPIAAKTAFADSEVKQASAETPSAGLHQAPGPHFGAQPQPAWRPKDAFDPEIFNRQFARAASSPRDLAK